MLIRAKYTLTSQSKTVFDLADEMRIAYNRAIVKDFCVNIIIKMLI